MSDAPLLEVKNLAVRFGSGSGAVDAVRGGLDPAKAVAAVTGDAAKILGLSDRVGLLEAGRDADLLVFSGDPLSPSSRLAAVVLDGRVVRRADRSQP